jgi:hypothetical protein
VEVAWCLSRALVRDEVPDAGWLCSEVKRPHAIMEELIGDGHPLVLPLVAEP